MSESKLAVWREYLVKGFAMDDDKIKGVEQTDWFDVDYDKESDAPRAFFTQVQNKMFWAVTRKTAAELFGSRSNSDAESIGLTSWHRAVVCKDDVSMARNYLTADEIDQLNLIVTLDLDFAELQAKNRKAITMEEWAGKLDAFLEFNEGELLTDASKVRAEVAKSLADTKREAADALVADAADQADLERPSHGKTL